MSQSPIPTSRGRGAKIVKLAIASVYAVTPLSLLVYKYSRGETVDTTILLIVVVFIIVSGYVIFGESAMESAIESAKEVTGEEDEEEEGGE